MSLFPTEAHLHQPWYLPLVNGRVCKFRHPLFCMIIEFLAFSLVLPSYNCILGVVWFRGTQESLQGKKCSPNSECWWPFVFEYIEANCTCLRTDVRMPYFGFETHFRWFVGVFRWESYINLIKSTLVDCVFRPLNVAFPVAVIPGTNAYFDIGRFGLNDGMLTVFAKSSNSFLIRRSFFIILNYGCQL